MSHAATIWAINQRGLKPATKIVLIQLADRHNKDTGRCNPRQEVLAADCEMSRSTLNLHLDELEKRGLIVRNSELDDRTKRQRPTSYTLLMGADAAQPEATETPETAEAVSEIRTEPCPEIGRGPCPIFDESRVRNPDTIENLGIEPGREEPSRRKRRVAIPENAVISPALAEIAEKHGIPPEEAEAQFKRFRDRANSKGETYANINAAWRNWLTSPFFRWITSHDARSSNAKPISEGGKRPDPALEQIARLAGIGQPPGDGRGGTRSSGQEVGPLWMGTRPQ